MKRMDKQTKQKYIEVVSAWISRKSIKNFASLYKYGFLYESVFTRPIWRVYRIIRNTVTHKYDLSVAHYKNDIGIL
ncbi:hypothetical protein bhn_II066 (plasmid) [Butyrivibrio hungatei]|uniref:Uncharacterized protein n=1 Tax=Butyrivibrio hungatei TaxID=185008 RepID=A0A1D9P6U9_9FIRM|nr:hypothetical protein bhn_II066 [Butyrivibrio hungatei]